MEYTSMKRSEQKRCVRLAAKAFENYDFFSVYVPKESRRRRFLRSMIKTEFKVNEGKVHFLTARENGRLYGVAILRAPDYEIPGDRAYLKAGFWKVLLFGGWKNVAAWLEMDRKAGLPCAALGDKTWFLHLLCVDTMIEGKGIGSRMIRDGIIPFAKEHGAEALSLYTNSEFNCRFYRKNGFSQFDFQSFTYNGKSFGSWSFRRDLI